MFLHKLTTLRLINPGPQIEYTICDDVRVIEKQQSNSIIKMAAYLLLFSLPMVFYKFAYKLHKMIYGQGQRHITLKKKKKHLYNMT